MTENQFYGSYARSMLLAHPRIGTENEPSLLEVVSALSTEEIICTLIERAYEPKFGSSAKKVCLLVCIQGSSANLVQLSP
jgi:hypothetical protein